MKLILDFDDVLFNTKQFKDYIFQYLKESGIPRSTTERYYKEIRATDTPFSLKKFLLFFFSQENRTTTVEDLHERILETVPGLLNTKLLDLVKKIGKNNCYIVTNGEEEFQGDKIKRSGVSKLFHEIYIVPGSKKDIIENICDKNQEDTIIFVDNKIEFFNDLNMKRCPNLKTIIWDEHGLENLILEIKKET